MPKKNFLQVALDNLKEALQQFSSREAVGGADKRSVKRGKKLLREIEKQYTNKEIGQALEVSPQKVTAIKKQIKAGKIASSTLNNLLEDTKNRLPELVDRPRHMTGQYVSDKDFEGKKKFDIDYIQINESYVNKNLPWAKEIKLMASKSSILNYYGGATGGVEYFVIVKDKFGGWKLYDIRTLSERSKKNKGTVSGSTRGEKIIQNDLLRGLFQDNEE